MRHTLFDERQKLRTKRVAGIPVSLIAVILVAGLAVAAIAYLGPFSAPVSQTTKSIYAVTGSAAEPAYGGIEPTLGFGVVDHVQIKAWAAGYAATQIIHLVIRISITGGFVSCAGGGADPANYLGDKDSVPQKISLDNDPLGGTVFQFDLTTGALVSGKCVYDTTVSAKTFSVLTTMNSLATAGNAFDLAWTYINVPPSALSFEFAAEV